MKIERVKETKRELVKREIAITIVAISFFLIGALVGLIIAIITMKPIGV